MPLFEHERPDEVARLSTRLRLDAGGAPKATRHVPGVGRLVDVPPGARTRDAPTLHISDAGERGRALWRAPPCRGPSAICLTMPTISRPRLDEKHVVIGRQRIGGERDFKRRQSGRDAAGLREDVPAGTSRSRREDLLLASADHAGDGAPVRS